MTEVGVDYPSSNGRSEEETNVVDKPPCADCIVRLVIEPNMPHIATSNLDHLRKEELREALEQAARKPADLAVNSLRVALCYCDHQHRWADVAGLSEEDKKSLIAKKAKRKSFPRGN